jgi:hypothetical protein
MYACLYYRRYPFCCRYSCPCILNPSMSMCKYQYDIPEKISSHQAGEVSYRYKNHPAAKAIHIDPTNAPLFQQANKIDYPENSSYVTYNHY